MPETKLYDLREDGYPNKRGDVFRSLQVFECRVCDAQTNRVIIGGYPLYGIRAVCPQASEQWHRDVEDKMRLADAPHPKGYLDELAAEISALKQTHADKATHDIEGTPDFSQKRGMTNVRGFKTGVRHGGS